MGPLARLVRALRRFLPGTEPATEREAEDARPAGEYRCAICGTPVDGPDGECPLCRSTDVVPADGEPPDAGSGVRGEPAETAVAGESTPTVGDVLSERDLLSAHGDRWTRADDGTYRVALPGGRTERAASKDDVRALLLEHYGPPGE